MDNPIKKKAFDIAFDEGIQAVRVSFEGFIDREQIRSWSSELTRFIKERDIRSPFKMILDFLRTKYMSSSAMDEFKSIHADMVNHGKYRALALIYFTPTGEEQIGKTLGELKSKDIIAHFANEQDAATWLMSM